jgi:Zn finger protein HypA/HybF involved in hydrogenase expression
MYYDDFIDEERIDKMIKEKAGWCRHCQGFIKGPIKFKKKDTICPECGHKTLTGMSEALMTNAITGFCL